MTLVRLLLLAVGLTYLAGWYLPKANGDESTQWWVPINAGLIVVATGVAWLAVLIATVCVLYSSHHHG